MRKFNFDKKYFYLGTTALIVVIISILCSHMLSKWSYVERYSAMIVKALRPIIIGLIIAYVLNPLMNLYEKYIFAKPVNLLFKKNKKAARGLCRGLSLVLAFSTAIALIASLILLIIPELYVNIEGIVKNMPTYVENGITHLTELSKQYPEVVTPVLEYFEEVGQDLLTWAKDKLLPGANTLIAGIYSGIYNTFKIVLDFILGFIICAYVLISKEKYAAGGRKLIYTVFSRENAEKALNLIKYTDKHFGGFLVGKIVDSAIIGVLSFVVFTIFNMPYTTLISVVIGITNIIPFFGPFIGAIPSALLILLVDPLKAVVFAILILAIQQLDGNIIGPKILGESTGMDSFAVIFAILFAGGLFGVPGMILGVPVFATIFGIVKNVCDKKLQNKKLPTSLDCYGQLKVKESVNGDKEE